MKMETNVMKCGSKTDNFSKFRHIQKKETNKESVRANKREIKTPIFQATEKKVMRKSVCVRVLRFEER